MFKKLKNTAGLTLVELMVTLLLLSLFSSACLVGINAAFASRRDHIRIGDAYILKATLTEAISQELRMCTEVVSDGDSITYYGGLTVDGDLQKKARLSVGDSSVSEYDSVPDPNGRLIKTVFVKLDSGTPRPDDYKDKGDPYPYKILNDSAYGEKGQFIIKKLNFSADDATHSIHVTFYITINDGDDNDDNDVKYATAEFDVYPLNGFTIK